MTVFTRRGANSVPQPAAYEARAAIVGSAQRINLSNTDEAEAMRRRLGTSAEWQKDAWAYFDAIGEIKFAYSMLGAVISRLRLYVGVVGDESEAPIPVHLAYATEEEEDDGDSTASDRSDARKRIEVSQDMAEYAVELFRKQMVGSSIPNILRSLSLNLDVPGEGYLVRYKDRWSAKSTSEITLAPAVDGFNLKESAADSGIKTVKKNEIDVGRVWRPHPEFSKDPDSALKGLRDDCEELLLLSRMIRITARAKLNAGVLFIPDELTVVARTAATDEETEKEGDPFEVEFLHAISESVTDEQSMATVAPIVVRGPADAGEKIRYINIDRKADEFLINRAVAVLDRILTSLDAPKDVITGLANVKYANAIQIDESMYKAHIEPKAVLICDAFTDIVLHPLLKKKYPDEDISRLVVWYDPSEVVTRPNQADDATTGYDNFSLSGAAWRDAHGFSESDAPGEDELAMRLALEKATVPEEFATMLLHRLLPSFVDQAREGIGEDEMPPELKSVLDGEDPSAEPPPVQEKSDPGGTQ